MQAPDQADLYVMLGLALVKLQDMMGTMDAFHQALQIDPHNATALEHHQFLRSMLGDESGT